MSEADIQAVLDGAASELGAAVSLGDVEDRLLAYTAHGDLMDEVRHSGLIHRRVTSEVRSWFEQWGIREATAPVRTPADETLGALARWCVPVRFRTTHLGYLWVLDAGSISEQELGPAVEAAEKIGALLYRKRLLIQADTDLLRLLLIPNPESESVAVEVRTLGNHTQEAPIAVIVVGAPGADALGLAALSDLTLAVQRTAEQASGDIVLAGTISGHGVLLARLRGRDGLASAHRAAETVRRLASHVNHDLEIVAAIGGATELGRASHSYAEAWRALRMARAMPDLGPVVSWGALGVFRALALLPIDEIESSMDPRVRGLLADKDLANTAEVFLDLAGNVQESAARLYVHRATLYQRLDRIATLYELDLRRRGDHRLMTHLGFKLSHMASQ